MCVLTRREVQEQNGSRARFKHRKNNRKQEIEMDVSHHRIVMEKRGNCFDAKVLEKISARNEVYISLDKNNVLSHRAVQEP